ncbi:MAG TPA: undecaprenyldiphospho-muramoylpentapeptide beta-N-acetylglucosaminyltransferase [Actinomycetota bacterium]|nr:undecaprenyldiphospho-muramoylpentapeptide beta-N-acetylglucosaminyltransferase [Actinomycetota bacterium]
MSAVKARSVVIAAGGTGGHIFPGLALADAIKRAAPGTRIAFVGTKRGLESRLVVDAGYPLDLIDMVPMVRDQLVRFPFALVRSVVQARRILRERGADVAVGMGGYSSAPLMIAARTARIPSLIHESGAIPGRANLFAARFTGNIALSFATAAKSFKRARVVGMPISDDLSRTPDPAQRAVHRATFGVPHGARVVLVIGGSQGATTLNRAAIGLAKRWLTREDLFIILKTGKAHLADIEREIDALGAGERIRCLSFIEKMSEAYGVADVAVCRAGAGTIAELAAVGLPAVLIPYPHAPYDHQAVNASVLVETGGAEMVRDHEATPDRLGGIIEKMLDDPEALMARRESLRSVAHPQAADELARWVLELGGLVASG